MALTKSSQTPQASASNAAGGTTTGSGLAINYGVSGVAVITNSGTGPTVACSVYIDFSSNNTDWFNGPAIGVGGIANSEVTRVPFALGIGAGGDWNYYRVRFTGNTGQAVTVQADAHTTTGL